MENDNEENVKFSKKENILNIIGIIMVICIFGIVTYYMIKVDGIDNIINVISNADKKWLFLGLIFTVIYWALEGVCFYLITKKIHKNQKFKDSFKLAIIGRLFNNITPMSCGDQPAQLLIMKKEGKSYSDGASILLTRFIIYQLVLVAYTVVIMLFSYNYFAKLIDNLMIFAIIGFVINIIVVILLIMVAVNSNFVMKICNWLIKIGAKLKIVKNKEEKLDRAKNLVEDFKNQFKMMKKEKLMIFKVALYTVIEITVLYTITYIVYRALGYNKESYLTIISAQAILAMITVYMPTPGAGLAAEGGFAVIFKNFFSSNHINPAILFWRLFTFYLPIIVGPFVLMSKLKKDKKK